MGTPTITPLPTPPLRSDAPRDFSLKADAFVAAIPGFASEANEVAGFVSQRAADANNSAVAAAASEAGIEEARDEVQLNAELVSTNTVTVVLRADEVAANTVQVASDARQVAADRVAVEKAVASIADGPVTSVNGLTGVVDLTAQMHATALIF